jgi:general stress protein 26
MSKQTVSKQTVSKQTVSKQLRSVDSASVLSMMGKRSFCTLATATLDGQPHAAAVLYCLVAQPSGSVLYVNTKRTSRKARNILANSRVSVCVPVRRIPFGPPASVQFGATATVLAPDDAEILRLVKSRELAPITSHGELDLPESCFLRFVPEKRLHTYGLGMSLASLARDPLNAGGFAILDR